MATLSQVSRLKRSPASLFGAFVIALGIFVMWFLVARELGLGGIVTLGVGLVVAAAVGVWIRVADL
jgi:hypothetical protein